MNVIYSRQFQKFSGPPAVLAIGSFDGIHLGHQKIIDKTTSLARDKKLISGLLSFQPHPRQVLQPDKVQGVLISQEQKIEILESLNIDYFFCQEFTREFARQNFADFVESVLYSRLNAAHIVVGEDFSFGRGGTGDVRDLKSLGKKYDFGVTIHPAVKNGGKKISSTRIRKLISQGRVEKVQNLLGRFYEIRGKVVHGQGRGKKLGFPTANLSLKTDYVLPQNGVYAGFVRYRDRRFAGAANFGENPTFSSKGYSIEIYILDLDEELYNEKISFSPVKFIRPEEKFSREEELVERIKQDILYTRKVLC